MGKRQIYRGNPTQKLYYLLNNYSGGIDRSKVDENMNDFEFRELVNTDIGEQGVLKKRKGFKHLSKLNELLNDVDTDWEIDASYQPLLFDVVKDENNILKRLMNDEGLTDEDNEGLTIITAGYLERTTYAAVRLYSYQLSVVGGVASLNTVDSHTFDPDTYLPLEGMKVEPIQTKTFIDKIYFSLNDLHDNLRGICYYSRDTDKFFFIEGEMKLKDSVVWGKIDTVSNPENNDAYKPKPYEINSITGGNSASGFNVLADNPLLYLDDQNTGLASLRSVILTDYSGNYLEKIPTSGEFVINVIETGDFVPETLQFIIKDEKGDRLYYEIGETSSDITTPGTYGVDNGGYFSYKIDITEDLSTVAYLLIDVTYKDSFIDWSNDLSYKDDVIDKTEDFLFTTTGDFKFVKYENFAYRKMTSTGHRPSDYIKVNIHRIAKGIDLATFDPETYWASDLSTTSNDNLYFMAISSDGNSCSLWQYNDATPTTFGTALYTNEIMYDDIWGFVPYPGTNIKVKYLSFVTGVGYQATLDYYMYNGFEVLNTGDSLYYYGYCKLSYYTNNLDLPVTSLGGQFFDKGNEEVEEPIVGLNLEGVKLEIINDRMLYYKGNTIYFSNKFQFDYVPNYAYLILPISSTDDIQKIKYFKGSWIIFTKESIWRMKGTYGDADWEITEINRSIGCVSADSVVSVNNTLMFYSNNGLYKLTQNYYENGLENVYKMDKKIPGLVNDYTGIKALLYENKVLFIDKSTNQTIIKMYYNSKIEENQYPFVLDELNEPFSYMFKIENYILTFKDDEFYIYDRGYTDFYNPDVLNTYEGDYTYRFRVVTPKLSMDYQTHNKKYKEVYVKAKAEIPTYLRLSVFVEGHLVLDPITAMVTLDEETEEVIYEKIIDNNKDSNIGLGRGASVLGDFELSKNTLGEDSATTHKITVGFKGKNIQLDFYEESVDEFSLLAIGYLYKLGKVKETY
jgi:hypothetical protein